MRLIGSHVKKSRPSSGSWTPSRGARGRPRARPAASGCRQRLARVAPGGDERAPATGSRRRMARQAPRPGRAPSRAARERVPSERLTRSMVSDAPAQRPVQRGVRFSPKARTPSRKSSRAEARLANATSSASVAGSSWPSASSRARITPCSRERQGRVRGDPGRDLDRPRGHLARRHHLADEPPRQRLRRAHVARGEEQLARARRADRVDELAQAGVGVDEPEPRRRHPEPRLRAAHAQVAGQRELEPAADRVAAERRDDGAGTASSASTAASKGWAISAAASSAKRSRGSAPMS